MDIKSLKMFKHLSQSLHFTKTAQAHHISPSTLSRVIQRMEDAKDPEQEGIEICAELMREISEVPGVSGVNLMTTGNADLIPAAIRASGLRS